MAKVREEPIGQIEMERFVDEKSDFSFECKVLLELNRLSFACAHAGTYTDPITKKTREFDIRGVRSTTFFERTPYEIHLAVECKNIRDYSPLLVHCVPRRKNECYHQMIWSEKKEADVVGYQEYHSQGSLLDKSDCIYGLGEPVGKNMDQVRCSISGDMLGGDSLIGG